jgi:PAS domain S-box-containing protein
MRLDVPDAGQVRAELTTGRPPALAGSSEVMGTKAKSRQEPKFSGELLAVLDRSGEIIAVDTEWERMFEAGGGQADTCGVGANYPEVCRRVIGKDGKIADLALHTIESVLSGRAEMGTMEYVCDLPTGPVRFLMKVKALSNPQGGAVVTHRRISAENWDLDAMRATLDQFQRMLDEAPALLCYVDADLRHKFVNRRYCEWLGRERDEIIGRPVGDQVGGAVFEAMKPKIERVLRGGAVDFEAPLMHGDGGTRYLRGSLVPDVGAGGEVRGYFSFFFDDTERHKTERELRSSEERFSKIFDLIPISMTISSLTDGTYLAVNESYISTNGFDRANVIGRTGAETGMIMPPDRVAEFLEELERNGRVSGFETDLLRADGSLRTVLLFAVKLELEGQPYAAVAANDITEAKQAERSLRELTTRLLNSQDAERRRIARELHDTTAQKLSALILSLFLVEKQLESPSKEQLRPIREATTFAEEALGEIRTLSYVLHPPLLDQTGLQSAVRWFVDGFRRRSGIDVQTAFAGAEARLPAEMEGAIFRIVQEALTNVHRHSGSSRAFILLDQRPEEIVLEVRDEGHGILPPADGGEPLEPVSIERLGVGIMGMSERLKQFGGELKIESGPGGTKVIARIPLSE